MSLTENKTIDKTIKYLKTRKLQKSLIINDVVTAKSCIENGAACDHKWISKFLSDAIRYDDIGAIKTYAESGLDLEYDLGTNITMTPLCFAASIGKLEAVEYLISKNAKLEGYGRTEYSALNCLIHNKDNVILTIIQKLADAGADLDFRDPYTTRNTPLMNASYFSQPDKVKLFIELGANQSLTNGNWKTAWKLSGTTEINGLLLDGHLKLEKEKSLGYMRDNQKRELENKDNTWSHCFSRAVSYTKLSPKKLNKKIEVFNFFSQNITTTTFNMKTLAKKQSRQSFSEYKNRARLKTACIEYNKLSSTKKPVSVDEIIRLRTKKIDGKVTNIAPLTIQK